MRADRLLATLLHIQRHGRATAPELAALFEVSVRTVYRDVGALQAAGIPLWTEAGRGGGIRLVDGWRAPAQGLTADEAGALLLAGAPDAVAALGLGAVMATAQVKLMSSLPGELRARAARAQQRFHLDAPGWFHQEESLPHLATVAEAVWSGRCLDVSYGTGPEPKQRRLAPLGLVLKSGTWYLVAVNRGRATTYRVGRIVGASVADEPVERPDSFDLAAWWQASASEFDRTLSRFPIRVRLSPRARRAAPTVMLGGHIEDVAEPTRPDPGDGWHEVEILAESEEVAAHQLLAFGPEVEVLEPQSLRARLRRSGLAMAAANW